MDGRPAPGGVAGKRMLVTGASSGIGAAIARQLAAAGAVVGLCARRRPELDRVLADCTAHSPGSRAWTVDLADLDGLERFAATVERDLGPLDVLVNNAGVAAATRMPDVAFEQVARLMHINYLSPVRLTLAVVPGMLRRGGGSILTVSSVAARLSPPTEAAYAASKAALSAFFEVAATDLWDRGIRVHLIYPGFIAVNDDPPDQLHAGLESTPAADVAAAVCRQLETGALETYVPHQFARLAAGRARDVEAFVAASAHFAAAQLDGRPPSAPGEADDGPSAPGGQAPAAGRPSQ